MIPKYKKQQALDALRKAVGWCQQMDVDAKISNVDNDYVVISVPKTLYDSSNLTLRLKEEE
jgi:hypothetical protein